MSERALNRLAVTGAAGRPRDGSNVKLWVGMGGSGIPPNQPGENRPMGIGARNSQSAVRLLL
jgi:hypothetical protein